MTHRPQEAAQGDKYRQMADASPLMIWLADEDGHGIYLNPPLLNFFGAPAQELLGAGWTSFIYPEDRKTVVEQYLSAYYTRQPYTMAYRMQRTPDTATWVQDIGLPRCAPNGEFAGYLGFVFDLSDFPAGGFPTDPTLRLLGERDQVVIIHQFDGTVIYWGHLAKELYGWSCEEMIGRKLDDFIYRNTPLTLDEIRGVLAQQGEWSGVLTQQTKDNQTVRVQARVNYLIANSHISSPTRHLITLLRPL